MGDKNKESDASGFSFREMFCSKRRFENLQYMNAAGGRWGPLVSARIENRGERMSEDRCF